MEYEIGDDPQGSSEGEEGDRDGGIREGLFFRDSAPLTGKCAPDRHEPLAQMGEAA